LISYIFLIYFFYSYIFSDKFEKAKEKLQKYEWTSDIATDDNENIGKRNRTKPKKYITTSSESSNEESTSHATVRKGNIVDGNLSGWA